MKGTILLNYDENVRQVEEEEKYRFLRDLLGESGIPVDEFWTTEIKLPLSGEQKLKLKEVLSLHSVLIIDDLDGHMQIYINNTLIGEWFKSTYKIRRDLRQIDPKKQLYVEMEVNFWTIFEEKQ